MFVDLGEKTKFHWKQRKTGSYTVVRFIFSISSLTTDKSSAKGHNSLLKSTLKKEVSLRVTFFQVYAYLKLKRLQTV